MSSMTTVLQVAATMLVMADDGGVTAVAEALPGGMHSGTPAMSP
jgi:hypothetical protein